MLDPPPLSLKGDLRKKKLLNRLNFISNWISLLYPRTYLAISLTQRVNDLQNLKNPFELDKVPLINAVGEKIVDKIETNFDRNNSYFKQKNHLEDKSSIGRINFISQNQYFFLGIHKELLIYAALMDFDKLLSYSIEETSKVTKVNCIHVHKVHKENNSFQCEGQIFGNTSGLVFGVINDLKN